MVNGSYAENAPESGVATLEVLGKEAQLMTFVPMRRVEISSEITGPVAGMQVVHVFSYTKEQCSRVIEAAYRFPLPGDAAVTGERGNRGGDGVSACIDICCRIGRCRRLKACVARRLKPAVQEAAQEGQADEDDCNDHEVPEAAPGRSPAATTGRKATKPTVRPA